VIDVALQGTRILSDVLTADDAAFIISKALQKFASRDDVEEMISRLELRQEAGITLEELINAITPLLLDNGTFIESLRGQPGPAGSSILYVGQWGSGLPYNVGNVVDHQGAFYIRKGSNTNGSSNAPGSSNTSGTWDLLLNYQQLIDDRVMAGLSAGQPITDFFSDLLVITLYLDPGQYGVVDNGGLAKLQYLLPGGIGGFHSITDVNGAPLSYLDYKTIVGRNKRVIIATADTSSIDMTLNSIAPYDGEKIVWEVPTTTSFSARIDSSRFMYQVAGHAAATVRLIDAVTPTPVVRVNVSSGNSMDRFCKIGDGCMLEQSLSSGTAPTVLTIPAGVDILRLQKSNNPGYCLVKTTTF